MSARKIAIAIAILAAFCNESTYAGDDRWFFTADAIGNAYKYQEQFGARLRNPLKADECFHGRKEFAASYLGRQFAAPCRFLTETIRQLRELIESGAAKYLFPLDVGHADFDIPIELWDAKYKNFPAGEMLPKLLHEPALVAVYHTAAHLDSAGNNTQSGPSIGEQQATVVGYYDGRPNQVLQPNSSGERYYAPPGFVRLYGFTLMGHRLGELAFVAGETVVTFDMSFDDDRAAASIPNNLASVRE